MLPFDVVKIVEECVCAHACVYINQKYSSNKFAEFSSPKRSLPGR